MLDDLLRRELIRLSNALADHGIVLIVGGGYGLVLKAQYLRSTDAATLREVPLLRSTDDIDVFLSAEVLTEVDKMRVLRETIDTLGFKSISGAQYYQFVRTVLVRGRSYDIKLDLLAAPPNDDRVIVDDRRVRVKEFRKLHAHSTPEAMSIEAKALEVRLAEQPSASVLIPHPFSFTVMKLFALRDQLDRADLGQGTRHAFDLYATWSMLVRQEWEDGAYFRRRFVANPILAEAIEIANELFADGGSPGVVRLRQHFRASGDNVELSDIDEFARDLREFVVGKRGS